MQSSLYAEGADGIRVMGVKVEGKPAKEVYTDIDAGKYDELLK